MLNINLDLTAVKTAMPVIANGTLVKARLTSVEQESNEQGPVLKFTYNLTEPALTTDGTQVSPGFPIIERIHLYAKPDAKNPKWFLERLARRMDALLGTGDPGNPKGKPARPPFNAETVSQMLGREVVLKLKVTEYEGVQRNEIERTFGLDEV